MVNLSEIRKEYKKEELHRDGVLQDPSLQLSLWLDEALAAESNEPTAMALATVSSEGRPSSRIVLLKGITDGRLTFYTNYHSRKGKQLNINPFAAITFFWPELERQVRVEGKVTKVPAAVSNAYFASRPKESQIGAIVSPQSEPIPDRKYLETVYNQTLSDYNKMAAVRPEHWGGYEVTPDYFEFWQGRPGRLHDRIAYTHAIGGNWNIERLAP